MDETLSMPCLQANVTSEVHGSRRMRFYYLVCSSCGAMVCLDGRMVL